MSAAGLVVVVSVLFAAGVFPKMASLVDADEDLLLYLAAMLYLLSAAVGVRRSSTVGVPKSSSVVSGYLAAIGPAAIAGAGTMHPTTLLGLWAVGTSLACVEHIRAYRGSAKKQTAIPVALLAAFTAGTTVDGDAPAWAVVALVAACAVVAATMRGGKHQGVDAQPVTPAGLTAAALVAWWAADAGLENTAFISLLFAGTLSVGLTVSTLVALGGKACWSESAAFRHAMSGLPKMVAVHKPIFSADGDLIDTELVWGNENWMSYRETPVAPGTRGSAIYVRFHEELVQVLTAAWERGKTVQFFRIDPGPLGDMNRLGFSQQVAESGMETNTVWMRTEAGLIVEWGNDVDIDIEYGSATAAARRAMELRRLELVSTIAARRRHQRIALELHDSIAQILYVMSLNLDDARVRGLKPDQAEHMFGTVEEMSATVKKLMNLDEAAPRKESIADRLAAMCDGLVRSMSWAGAPEVVFVPVGSPVDFLLGKIPMEIEDAAFAVAREAVANAVKHASASLITVEVEVVVPSFGFNAGLELRVADNGVGLPEELVEGSGLASMRERASDTGGCLQVGPRGQGRPGTSVVLRYEAVGVESEFHEVLLHGFSEVG